jgi:protoporphyrinogen oxidase
MAFEPNPPRAARPTPGRPAPFPPAEAGRDLHDPTEPASWPAVVIGGGVSGLTVARLLARSGAQVLLLERGSRLGGKILTRPLAGLPLEAGPDGFLDRPQAIALCRELGLEPELVETLTTRAFRWEGAGLRPLGAEPGRPGAGSPPPRLLSLRRGLRRLVERLEEDLDGRSPEVQVRLGAAVERVERAGAALRLRLGSGATIETGAAVIATPAPEAARLVASIAPEAAAQLARIPYLDLAVVNLVYPGRPWPLEGSGFLVAEEDRRLISGCTWLSSKWPHLRSPGRTAVRATVGGSGRREWMRLDDSALVARVHRELVLALGPAPPPELTQVTRWRGAVPDPRCLDPGCADRAQAALPPDLALAAGGYRGGGISSCIATAAEAAGRVRARLGAG